MFTLSGTVEKLSPVQHIGEKNYPKQLVWIQTAGKYPQTIELEAFGDRANDTSILSIGDQVDLTFDLKGRKWTGKDGIEKWINNWKNNNWKNANKKDVKNKDLWTKLDSLINKKHIS